MNGMKLSAAVLGILLGAPVFAADTGVCKSMCTTEKQECRANAKRLTELDREVLVAPESKNPFDRTNNAGQVASIATQANERTDAHRRVSERNGQCDATYLRCTRACDTPGHTDLDSVIQRHKQPDAGVNAGAAGR